MNKPQVNINLNIEIPMSDMSEKTMSFQIKDAIARAHLIQEQLAINVIQDGITAIPLKTVSEPTSRHHQSVAANTRIMDAIEFINKEMRLLKGHSENGTLKVFEEIRRILLGI